jgi:AmmeMemoRadiSam system protein A
MKKKSKDVLLRLARDSIRHGLSNHSSLKIELQDYAVELQSQRSCFVTLEKRGELRGCMGHLEAFQPLVHDVAENAFSAAFKDPRFPALSTQELEDIHIEISILSPSCPMQFSNEKDLIQKIRPGKDGLILSDGNKRGTFLPSVWESLPNAREFWLNLKQKAGLPLDHWSESLRVDRYEVEKLSE